MTTSYFKVGAWNTMADQLQFYNGSSDGYAQMYGTAERKCGFATKAKAERELPNVLAHIERTLQPVFKDFKIYEVKVTVEEAK
jgi:hypothetical protein